ncbi:type IV toxin-antitoxin system AbiEi family antitoxin domain-containing protein [Blastococcus sp. LR1]|uniref:type IV toxin-antitoxin system AbiEi family antitoxin domain-containing protein n=1 Tax=Blastococcus sp. LR1 TaxID=2877000 RepID=UPI001CCDF069|nr:type IV toxin-antitoxin system AbiEi family antitoxin domain-containing protein [Blastococcus sp. LR1]MCA0145815.1 type IV toxin-antitoxin system AbiEi family antitoxin domain-containing protein [Blastococcus sp. LR1]
MHPLLEAAAGRQLGVFTAGDVRRAGYRHDEVRHLRASGRWHRLRRGVYITATELAAAERAGNRFRVECVAVLLAMDSTTVAVSHRSAAHLWGLPAPTPDVIRLTDPAHSRVGSGFRVSRGPLDPGDVRTQESLRLTAPARTLVDLARSEPLTDAVVAMDAALLGDLLTLDELGDATARAHGWPGAARAARALSLTDGRAESALETRGRLRMIGAGLPTPQLQVEIRTGGRLIGVVDAWFEGPAVAVEFDGRVKYTDPWRDPGRVLWEEKRREDELRALDIAVVRIAEADLGTSWPRTEQQLRRLLARPAPVGRRFTATPRTRGVARAG